MLTTVPIFVVAKGFIPVHFTSGKGTLPLRTQTERNCCSFFFFFFRGVYEGGSSGSNSSLLAFSLLTLIRRKGFRVSSYLPLPWSKGTLLAKCPFSPQ